MISLSQMEDDLRRWDMNLYHARRMTDYFVSVQQWSRSLLGWFHKFAAFINKNTVAMMKGQQHFEGDPRFAALWAKMEKILIELAQAFGPADAGNGEVAAGVAKSGFAN